jgi:hypothetical protein
MVYFETVGVVAGSRWDKRVYLSPYDDSPRRTIRELVSRWKAADPLAPTRFRIFGIKDEPIECDMKELLARGFLFEDE